MFWFENQGGKHCVNADLKEDTYLLEGPGGQ
jgi:hypothetical protein